MVQAIQRAGRPWMRDGVDMTQLALPLDSPLIGRVKNDRTVMVFNFFALIKERVRELPVYDDGQVRIQVTGDRYGVANIWDKEILIYLASLIQDKMNRGEPASPQLTFTGHDFFRACCIHPSGASYERLQEALRRLIGTKVETNIETGGHGEDAAFSWIAHYRMDYQRTEQGKRLKGVTVQICDWLFRAIVNDGRMLTYHLGYFKLGPLEKRVYEIARAHCGNQGGFRIGLEKLRVRVGSTAAPNRFKKRIADMALLEPSPIPEYGFILLDPLSRLQEGRVPATRVPLARLQVYFFPLCGKVDIRDARQISLVEE
jgi:plasmid replication initiation protein